MCEDPFTQFVNEVFTEGSTGVEESVMGPANSVRQSGPCGQGVVNAQVLLSGEALHCRNPIYSSQVYQLE